MITEKEFQNKVLEYLFYKNVFCFPYNSIGVFDKKNNSFRRSNNKFHINGVSDILGIYCGRMLAIELKRPKFSKRLGKYISREDDELCKMASFEQIDFLNKVRKHGGCGILADSWERIEKEMSTFKHRIQEKYE